jgi:hypothetical protein
LIQNPTNIRDYCFYFMFALFGLMFVSSFLICCTKLRFRLENVYKNFCWYKWLFWFCELTMLPVMFNVAWLANCEFHSKRDGIILANCMQDGNHWPNILIITMTIMFMIVFSYNYILYRII